MLLGARLVAARLILVVSGPVGRSQLGPGQRQLQQISPPSSASQQGRQRHAGSSEESSDHLNQDGEGLELGRLNLVGGETGKTDQSAGHRVEAQDHRQNRTQGVPAMVECKKTYPEEAGGGHQEGHRSLVHRPLRRRAARAAARACSR